MDHLRPTLQTPRDRPARARKNPAIARPTSARAPRSPGPRSLGALQLPMDAPNRAGSGGVAFSWHP
ncbi:hypothetical protein GCM10010112_47320 [Actinoplanes lobatus]|nr:hypothetical protein GCM10010112_47320 [Actinoplanes lobatus]